MTTVLICDDHRLVREGLRQFVAVLVPASQSAFRLPMCTTMSSGSVGWPAVHAAVVFWPTEMNLPPSWSSSFG